MLLGKDAILGCLWLTVLRPGRELLQGQDNCSCRFYRRLRCLVGIPSVT